MHTHVWSTYVSCICGTPLTSKMDGIRLFVSSNSVSYLATMLHFLKSFSTVFMITAILGLVTSCLPNIIDPSASAQELLQCHPYSIRFTMGRVNYYRRSLIFSLTKLCNGLPYRFPIFLRFELYQEMSTRIP